MQLSQSNYPHPFLSFSILPYPTLPSPTLLTAGYPILPLSHLPR